MHNWTIFSNHGHVLVCLARDREARLRDVATDVGITERAVQKIVRDLQDCGMLDVRKHGRRNHYRIHLQQPLRHALEGHCSLAGLLAAVGEKPAPEKAGQITLETTADKKPAPEPARTPTEESVEPPVTEARSAATKDGDKPTAPSVETGDVEHQQRTLF